MPNLITYIARNVPERGLKKTTINQNKLKEYFLTDDYETLELLNKLPTLKTKEEPILFYPGCGSDILFPLHYVEKLFPETKTFKFLFNDIDPNLDMIKTVLDDINIPFSTTRNGIKFHYKELQINLKFVQGDIFPLVKDLIQFDIYFERAFRIMKERDEYFETTILAKLNPGGVLISDSGFYNTKLKEIKVPQKLSSYGEMIIATKSIPK